MPKRNRVRTPLIVAAVIVAVFGLVLDNDWFDPNLSRHDIADLIRAMVDPSRYNEVAPADEIADTGVSLQESAVELSEAAAEVDLDPGDEVSDASPGLADTVEEGAAAVGEAVSDDDGDSAPAAEAEPAAPDEPPAREPEPEPDPEPSDALAQFALAAFGLSFKTREYYSVGNKAAGVAKPDAYAYVKSSFPSMRVELHAMDTDQLPGETPDEALQSLYQERLVEGIRDSGEWSTVTEPSDLEVNGQPASRMAVEFARTDDKVFCYHLTAIRGAVRSGFVQGSYGAACGDDLGRDGEITAVADSVELGEPEAVCWVGQKPDVDPVEYAVGCDYPALKFVGLVSLNDSGYTDTVLGPVTYDEAVVFMREHDQPRW